MLRRLLLPVRRRIAVKLTLTLVGFTALTILVAGIYLGRALEGFAVEALEARLATAGRLLVDDGRRLLAPNTKPEDVHAFAVRVARPTQARVTLIGADGRVLGDSDVPVDELPRVENHAGRPEVRMALAGRLGRDLRQSATVSVPLLYVAIPVTDGGRVTGVLRLALPLSAITASYAAIRGVLLAGGLVALVVATGLGIFIAGRVTRPVVEMQAIARQMSEGQFGVRAPTRSVDEIGALGRALNVMTARLREKIHDLEQEQAKATAILDGMIEGVIAVDEREAIILTNERARAMFGLTGVRAEGRPFLEVIRNADLHEIFRQGRATAGGVVRREVRLAHPVVRTLEAHAVPLRLGAVGRGVVIVLHDVTALRRLEQVRTEFVANVSHELRTPLTAIQGYLETLLGGALEERENARRFLEIAFRHTERLGRLLNDLTDLSNIELGKVTLRRQATPVEDVVESTLAIIQPRAEAGRVTLSTGLPSDLPAVHADHDRLAQILINLVDNAVKYTPPEGQVRVSARVAHPGMVELEVTDTGIGIPRVDLPRITERFYRVDKARSRELGGTGLGLAIVKHLVIAHGGELSVESEQGRGTTVRFTLPTAAPRAPAIDPAGAASS
jgi:two-component system, OmpR family, phosphate regulon sensor histidine kinase PhoR